MPRHRSRSRERRYHRRSRSRSRQRRKEKDRSRSRSKERKTRSSHRAEARGRTRKSESPSVQRKNETKPEKKRDRETSASPKIMKESDDSAKRRRLEKLQAWKNKQALARAVPAKPEVPQLSEPPKPDPPPPQSKPAPADLKSAAWVPWDDPTPAFDLAHPPVPDAVQRKRTEAALRDIELMAAGPRVDEVDPLDAFMASEVMPEVNAKEQEEKKRLEEDRIKRAKLIADGKTGKGPMVLEDSDSEEEADWEIEVPMNKVKLIIGPNGTKIQEIQKKSKCRIQVKKDDAEMNRAFGSGPHIPVPADGKPKMVTIMIFGDARGVEFAEQLITEAVENREQKQKQRQKEYERKREAKVRDRQIYHLRHARDYEALGLSMGASKASVKSAYRKLAVKWHPDKHPEDPEGAKAKFQEIQQAYQSLMSTSEDDKVEQIGV
ncbi:hypothetical protein BSKO_01882 [Bryopsis sp. KO-2023]|nr:hypothetical protein BSKO_01882 [Bryopsis sp. KO-2023]